MNGIIDEITDTVLAYRQGIEARDRKLGEIGQLHQKLSGEHAELRKLSEQQVVEIAKLKAQVESLKPNPATAKVAALEGEIADLKTPHDAQANTRDRKDGNGTKPPGPVDPPEPPRHRVG